MRVFSEAGLGELQRFLSAKQNAWFGARIHPSMPLCACVAVTSRPGLRQPKGMLICVASTVLTTELEPMARVTLYLTRRNRFRGSIVVSP